MRADFSMTRIAGLQETRAAGVNAAFIELRQLADSWFVREGIAAGRRTTELALDMRYLGQSHELTVPVQEGAFSDDDIPGLAARFRREHERVYGYAPEGRLQVVTYRLTAGTPITAPPMGTATIAHDTPAAPIGSRSVYFQSRGGRVDCPVHDRASLVPEMTIEGPAIIEQMDTTTVILPDQTARVARDGMLRLTFRTP
jgi:N-methylhydantoinase A